MRNTDIIVATDKAAKIKTPINRYVLLFLGLILLGVGGLGGYYLATNQTGFFGPIKCSKEAKLCLDGSYVGRTGSNCEFSQCPEMAVNPTETPVVDLTGEWETYTDLPGEYYFRHPTEATIEIANKPSISLIYLGTEQIKSGRTQTELMDGYKVDISYEFTAPGDTAQNAAIYSNNNVTKGCPDPSVAKVSEIDEVEIGGKNAYHYTLTNCISDSEVYFIQHSNKIYTIGLLYSAMTDTQKETYRQTIFQILNTFDFTK